jgi:hypothetical protein
MSAAWESKIGLDVTRRFRSGMITSTMHVLILVPVLFAILKESGPIRYVDEDSRMRAEY